MPFHARRWPILLTRSLAVLVTASALAGSRASAWGDDFDRVEEIRSPGGEVTARLELLDGHRGSSCVHYQVWHRGRPVVLSSPLALRLEGGSELGCGLRIIGVKRSSTSRSWKPPYGERSSVPDRYRELVMDLEETAAPRRRLQLVLRAYDEGAALRYRIPVQPGLDSVVVIAERTAFHFPEGTYGYEEHGTEGEYHRVAVTEIEPKCERPLTLEYPDGRFAAVLEAGNERYSRMLLSPHPEIPGALVSDLDGPARGVTPFETPWRVLMVGDRPGDLLEHSYLSLLLSPPSRIHDTSWIRPGKAFRETTLSTPGGKASVDFAVQHGLQYVLLDAGWYGPENDDSADARTVSVDPKRAGPNHPGLDLQEVIRYAKERGIGIFLYVNRRALERQLDEILPLYESWGVKGVKFGFVQVGPQKWTEWLHRAVAKAAEHRLMVDVHDGYRPTGLSRTYPNWLTQEGVRGNEHMPTAEHNVTLPFTRLLAGAADYTICYYDSRLKTTHAHQLALAVVNYSPLQLLFWYDRPSAYQGEPEIKFFDRVPTVWDDTRVVDGKIGDFVVIARRSGEEWYLGSLTDDHARDLAVPLAFLDPGRRYVAHVYGDGGADVATRTGVAIHRYLVDRTTVLRSHLAASGGQAVRIVPASAGDLSLYPPYAGGGNE